jgi:hypothetical protein
MLIFILDDGGRTTKRKTGDCVTRAVAIASGRPYEEIYLRLAEGTGRQRASSRTPRRAETAHDGIKRKWFRDYMAELGFVWTPTMQIGQGCKVHLRAGELPPGRLVVALSKHYTAVIDGNVYDTADPSRGGTRCVYGIWRLERPPGPQAGGQRAGGA